MKRIIQQFIALLYPRLCEACGASLHRHEEVLCLHCLYHLPRTDYWKEAGNSIEQLFWGKIRLEHVCALFFFNKGSRYRHLLHKLKYKGKKYIGIELGRRLGLELKSAALYQTVDTVIPVPLHPKKQRRRGYNQSEQIAIGIAEATGWNLDTQSVCRHEFTATQTRKSRLDRWRNVAEVFAVKRPSALQGKHVLLVDDVITTGATIEACAQHLINIEGCRVSVAALACVK
ncbi:MAG: ComF family protein [Bacteroidales bacterium]|nr:ComF family protein [Bacteroidales bacterium]MCL2132842.1 ComF family protein [Bacteroidales bacterium]